MLPTVMLRETPKSGPGWLDIQFGFNKTIIETIKQIPGVAWVKDRKTWTAPRSAAPALREVLAPMASVRESPPLLTPFATSPLSPFAQQLLAPARDYQREAVYRLLTQQSYVLAFDMRVGKTLCASVATAIAMEAGAINTVLIAYPNAVADEVWPRQLERWAMGLKLIQLDGKTAWSDAAVQHLITVPFLALGISYELLDRGEARKDDLLRVLGARRSFALIADEVQNVQNRKAGRSRHLREISRLPNGYYRWGLTGTPMRNTPKNLWGPFDLIQPNSAGSYSKWTTRYCNPPEAPIWMGDFSFKRLGDVRVGDSVIGWARAAGRDTKTEVWGRDRLCRATVLDVYPRSNVPVVKVTFESGRTLRCTPDHLWLNRSTGGAASVPLGETATAKRNLVIKALAASGLDHHEIAEQFGLTYQRIWSIVCGGDLSKFAPAVVGRKLAFVVDPVEACVPPELERLAGWLGGMYDGEGHRTTISQSSVVNPVTWKRLDEALTILGVAHTMTEDRASGAGGATITGGRAGFLRFLQLCKPVRDAGRDKALLMGRFKTPDRVISIVPDGESDVVGLKTTTGNYVVWGYASKNCDGHEGDYGWEDDGESNPQELAARLAAFSYRLTRADVAQWLPKSERSTFLCEMSQQAAAQYQAAESILGPKALAGLNSESATGIAALRTLAKFVSGSKMEKLKERVAFHLKRGVKLLVVAHHHDTLKFAATALTEAQLPHFVIGGWIPRAKRTQIAEEWRALQGPAALLINTLSSGIGIDLADADGSIVLELTWVPADFLQMEARTSDVHQGKRTAAPWFEYLLVRGTIDEDMALKLISKIDAAERIVGSNAEAQGVNGALRESGVVDRNVLSLANEDPGTVTYALDAMVARLSAKPKAPAAADEAAIAEWSNAALAAALDDAIDEDASEDEAEATP